MKRRLLKLWHEIVEHFGTRHYREGEIEVSRSRKRTEIAHGSSGLRAAWDRRLSDEEVWRLSWEPLCFFKRPSLRASGPPNFGVTHFSFIPGMRGDRAHPLRPDSGVVLHEGHEYPVE